MAYHPLPHAAATSRIGPFRIFKTRLLLTRRSLANVRRFHCVAIFPGSPLQTIFARDTVLDSTVSPGVAVIMFDCSFPRSLIKLELTHELLQFGAHARQFRGRLVRVARPLGGAARRWRHCGDVLGDLAAALACFSG